ncbi:MAG: molybdenum cofactor biosynthesis protein B [Zestosphaera sp.]
MPVEEHRRESSRVEVKLCLLITSNSIHMGLKKDVISPTVERLCVEHGVPLVNRLVVPNDGEEIKKALTSLLSECNVILVTGGTGISPRDVSVESLRGYCVKDMPGFGELFRYLSFLKHGSAAMASRSFACVVGSALIFVVPGSPDAVETAMSQLILPEARHLLYELSKT